MVLIKLPEHIPEIKENNLLQTYTVILVNNYDYDDTEENNVIFCWPCIIVYQYSETNVMHILFSLLNVTGLYLFRALLTHSHEALNKQHLVN
jgi:hypothetical protein